LILVDTSVLIDYLKGNCNDKTDKLDFIIDRGIEFGINNLIYQEILQGAATSKEFNILNDYLSSLKFYYLKLGLKSYENAAKYYFECRKKGITVRSTIDMLIVETALENDLYLLHNDRDFDNVTKVITGLKIYQ
jgi:predicted nucleic acid-binding protein